MNALCCQKVWDLSSELTWQHAFSVSGVTLTPNWDQNPGKLTVGAYPCEKQQEPEGWHPIQVWALSITKTLTDQ